jgi:hypothetical protein
MAIDNYGGNAVLANQSYVSAEVADFSSTDHTFVNVPTALSCSGAGTLYVDFLNTGSNVPVFVLPGENKMRVTKIYNAGSSSITVTGLY